MNTVDIVIVIIVIIIMLLILFYSLIYPYFIKRKKPCDHCASNKKIKNAFKKYHKTIK